MSIRLWCVAVAAMLMPAVAGAEVVTVAFDNSTPTTTQMSYAGSVIITVSGTGQSAGANFNDAFYQYADGSGNPTVPDDRGFYDLGFGISLATVASIDDYVVPTPTYNPTHFYTFTLATGLSSPAPLYFNLQDDQYGDNSGSFTVAINPSAGAVPEPATWAMMVVGFGLVGLGARRRIRSIVDVA